MEVSISLLQRRGLPNSSTARTANQATEPQIALEHRAIACALAICYGGPTILDEFAESEAIPAAAWLGNRRCRHSWQLGRLCLGLGVLGNYSEPEVPLWEIVASLTTFTWLCSWFTGHLAYKDFTCTITALTRHCVHLGGDKSCYQYKHRCSRPVHSWTEGVRWQVLHLLPRPTGNSFPLGCNSTKQPQVRLHTHGLSLKEQVLKQRDILIRQTRCWR
jgi:hypothetical protein